MEAIYDALNHTPWWVFLLFIYLLKVGVDASKPSKVSLIKLFILPTLFFLLSLNNLYTAVQTTPFNFLIYGIFLGFGLIVGYFLVKNLSINFDPETREVILPGTYTTLVLILFIFSSKYYFGYSLANDPNLLEDTYFERLMLAVSSLWAGIMVGRLGRIVYALKREV